MMRLRLANLPVPARLAIALFALGLLGLHAAAQATLWATAGDGAMPGPDEVLWKYHGHPQRTTLHQVLDPSLPADSTKRMFPWLDPAGLEAMDRLESRRLAILSWVEGGATRDGWPDVRRILHEEALCLNCHGFGGVKQDLPLESYEDVFALAQPGRGIATRTLLVSAHNHLFAFAVASLLLGLLVSFSALRAWGKALLVASAFLGAFLDVGGWFLTAAWGAPWQYAVVLGGAAFGISTGAMIAVLLDEVVLGGRIARALGLAEAPTTGS